MRHRQRSFLSAQLPSRTPAGSSAPLLLLALSLAVAPLCRHSLAQAREAAPETTGVAPTVLRATTRNVLLDVVVTDRNGNTVRNLQPGDFIVKEEGVEQNVRVVETPGAPSAATGAGSNPPRRANDADNSSAASRMRTLILLDQVNVKFFDLAYARAQLDKFLASPMAAQQNIGILSLSNNRLVMVHDFTTDREALRASLRALKPTIPGTANVAVDEYTDFENFSHAISALETIGRSLAGSTVRTNCVWITSGFLSMAKLINSPEVQDNFDAIMHHTANLYLGARMSIYTVDPHGVQFESSLPQHNAQPFVPPGGNLIDYDAGAEIAHQTTNMTSNSAVINGFLDQLDERTGGRGYANGNDISGFIGKAIEDAGASYLLAYSPKNHDFHGEYRRIRVQLRPSGLHARTRDGYLAEADPAQRRANSVRDGLARALESPLPYDALQAHAILHQLNSHPVVEVRLSPQNVEWTHTPAGKGGSVTQIIAVAAYARNGKPIYNKEFHVSTSRLDLDQGNDLVYSIPVLMPPGTERMRVAVLDLHGTHMGTTDVALAGQGSPPGNVPPVH